MDAEWKLNWDYNGWRKISKEDEYNPYSQKDWNNTLLTKINQISAKIHMSSLLGGANRISINLVLFDMLTPLLYDTIYTVVMDDKLPLDKIYVYYDGDNTNNTSPNKLKGEITITNIFDNG